MTVIWNRDWQLTIGRLRIVPSVEGTSLRVAFEVEKSTGREPNTATIRIWNLGRQRRDALTRGDQLELMAGYADLTSMIFSGEARHVASGRDSNAVDIVTVIECRDGGAQYRTTRLDQSWIEGTPVRVAVDAAVGAMGVGRGNLDQYVGDLALTATEATTFVNGYTSSGPAWRVLGSLLSSCGLSWSVQDGNLQVRRAGQPAERRALVLGPGTGLIGSPSIDAAEGAGARRREPTVNASAQLIPGVYPGRVVSLRSSTVSGSYSIKRVRSVGDSHGDDWRHDLVLEAY